MTSPQTIKTILQSRRQLKPDWDLQFNDRNQAAEGGCGVIGLACSEKIGGRHMLQALQQMRNRGNGKGGGIAAVGLDPDQFGVSRQILEQDYLLVIAYLDQSCRADVEEKYINTIFEIDHSRQAPHIEDHTTLHGLDVRPPEVYQYFVRVKQEAFDAFQAEHNLDISRRQIEDEIVFQNTFQLNKEFYASTGDTRAFVLSHGRNLLVIKMVGYADDVIRYYQLEDINAHVWIGHHRYPTKGRVWHPGGAHPFIGMNEALVHNGDFANYASISEYLAQRNIYPLFLTDTEVSVQVFDLLHRTYQYPLEYVIESLAPTTERDFTLLPPEKQDIYHNLQVMHMHSSPDGPWFFLIAQSQAENEEPVYRLTCITDTSMLRPQVFAWQQAGDDGPAIGFAASEKQGIDAALTSLAASDNRFWSVADRYWNARGGSHTDGGAFIFTARPDADGQAATLTCTDKFGQQLHFDTSRPPYRPTNTPNNEQPTLPDTNRFEWITNQLPNWDYEQFRACLAALLADTETDNSRQATLDLLTGLVDRRFPLGQLRRSSLTALCHQALNDLFALIQAKPTPKFTYQTAADTPAQTADGGTAIIDARGFEPEGPHSVATRLNALYNNGFRHFLIIHCGGHRFIGNGFGPDSSDVRIDVYGASGDYLASGIDGMDIYVHGNAQDQLAQIMKAGKLVVYGDVGQTFGYAAKGGQAYILGNAAGRPLINAVGKPRFVINGTCLDYLAESFMAGDPHNNGGFVILNGIHLNDNGQIEELPTPYPGGNLFSLASGGAIFVRDPHRRLTKDQLNGGEFYTFTYADWNLIKPYLAENELLFGITIDELLTVDGHKQEPTAVYRKIAPAKVRALQAEEAWVAHK
ncbi:MAG TPA: glutamate synthase [Anaerolineae bacterium]|nr:glutamate synthase [Anaerolineae bacterium]